MCLLKYIAILIYHIAECSALTLVAHASFKPVEFYTRHGACRGYDMYRSHYNKAFGAELFLDEPLHTAATPWLRGGRSPCHPDGSYYNTVSTLCPNISYIIVVGFNPLSAMVTIWHQITVSFEVLAQTGFIATWIFWVKSISERLTVYNCCLSISIYNLQTSL
jgi:hypothetical protein